jgi:hypothetical protein
MTLSQTLPGADLVAPHQIRATNVVQGEALLIDANGLPRWAALVTNAATTGTPASVQPFLAAYTGLLDGVATATCTVTIPNAANAASVRLTIVGSLGAGGAIGADEGTASIAYDVAVARTAGVAAVVTFSTAYGSATAHVAGSATCAVTAAASSIAGAVGVTNTFTVNVTITAGSGSATHHTCLVRAELINANASGVTISA